MQIWGRLVRSKKYRRLTEATAVEALVRVMNGPWYWRALERGRAWWATVYAFLRPWNVYAFLRPWKRGAACPECGSPVWHRRWHGEPQTWRTCPPRCNLGLGAPMEYDWRTNYQTQRSWVDIDR